MGQTRRVVVATHNQGKLAEMRRILVNLDKDAARRIELVSADELGLPDPVETGTSFEANALLKADAAARASGLPALADDSGLIVDVLGAAPGILSARWSGRHGDDKANMDLLLAQLADMPDEARTGAFICAAALVMPDPRDRGTVRLGRMSGRILREPRGRNGFGYDPVFLPDDQPSSLTDSRGPLTSAQMTQEEKNRISHRGKALRAIMPVLVERLATLGPAFG